MKKGPKDNSGLQSTSKNELYVDHGVVRILCDVD